MLQKHMVHLQEMTHHEHVHQLPILAPQFLRIHDFEAAAHLKHILRYKIATMPHFGDDDINKIGNTGSLRCCNKIENGQQALKSSKHTPSNAVCMQTVQY